MARTVGRRTHRPKGRLFLRNNRDRQEIVEQFTFRYNGREYTVDDAVIDTGATNTVIGEDVVEALQLEPIGKADVLLAGGTDADARRYRCIVAWTIYESQGYYSSHDVLCISGSSETLIGFDFLSRHQLKVDMHHGGLVGTAPPNAQPLTGGGYGLNIPRWYLLEMNRARFEAAKPGEVLRPHPAWRFTLPAVVKKR